jgi:glutamate racemase
MATEVTLREEKFDTLLHRFDENCTIAKIPAPGLVPLIEAGLTEDPRTDELLRSILGPYVGQLDALVLGCTHYPFAAGAIRRILGDGVVLLDGGEGTARETQRRLGQAGLLSEAETGTTTITSSAPGSPMIQLATQLLEKEM